MFNKRLKERLEALEVVLDALISILTHKKVMSREEIQRQILETAAKDKNETRR